MAARPGRTRRDLLRRSAQTAGALALWTPAGRLLTACGSDGGPRAADSLAPSPWGTGVYAVGDRDLVTLGAAEPTARYFYYAIVSDTHVADDVYFAHDGVEGSDRDTESMRHTAERFAGARDLLNRLAPRLDMVFVPGDVIHNYPTVEMGRDDPHDMAYYMANRTRIDIAKEIADGFQMPVFMGYGNHDYDVGRIERAFTEELFLAKLHMPRFYAVDHRGVKFVHLNNFLGATQDVGHELYDPGIGSLGESQLLWLEAQLELGMPTVLFIHYAPGLGIVQEREVADLDLFVLLRRYREQIMHVISGHTHMWMDLANTVGPPHDVVAATRYDPNAFAVVEVDTQTWTHTLLYADLRTPLNQGADALDPARHRQYVSDRVG